MSEKILLIDLSSIARPIFEAAINLDAVHTAIVGRVRELASGHTHVAICCDAGRSFRKDISADYKANRPETPGAYIHQVTLAQEILHNDGFPVWSLPGYEADDLIATAITNIWPLEFNLTPSDNEPSKRIVSADKDLLQLVTDRVEQISPITNKVRGPSEVKAEFGVEPHQMLDYLALVGDKSDNITGAAGIGRVNAGKLLAQFGNLEDMETAIKAGAIIGTPAVQKSLAAFFESGAAKLAKSLITLRTDAPIPFEEIFVERTPKGDTVGDGADDADRAAMDEDIAIGMPTLEPPSTEDRVWKASPQERIAVAVETAIKMEKPSEKPRALMPVLLAKEADYYNYNANVANVQGQQQGQGYNQGLATFNANQGVQNTGSTASVAPVEWDRQLEPANMKQAWWIAQQMHASRLFSAYGTPQAVLSTIIAGRELGLPVMASLRAFHIIENKPTLSAGIIMSLVLKSDKCEYFRCIERTNERATFETKRKGDPPTTLSYTIEDARMASSRDASKFASGNYGKNPADMLVARASSKLARLVYADVVSGLYSPEEFER